MATNEFETLKQKVSKIDKDEIYETICKNIKKYRLENYNEFKKIILVV